MIVFKDFEPIGQLGKIHGIKGEISADIQVDLTELIKDESNLFLMVEINKLLVPFRLLSYRSKGANLSLLTFSDINTKEEAMPLQGLPLYFSKEYLEDIDDEQITDWGFFIDYVMVDASNNNEIGTIHGIEDSTMNMLFIIECSDGRELLIPIVPELITQTDTKNKRIFMSIPDGLLDI